MTLMNVIKIKDKNTERTHITLPGSFQNVLTWYNLFMHEIMPTNYSVLQVFFVLATEKEYFTYMESSERLRNCSNIDTENH